MTNNQLTSTRLAVKSELDGYKIHASRGQATALAMVRLFESIDKDLAELQERRKAAMDSEPVAFTEEHEISNMHATGLYLRAWPADRARNAVEGYTIPLYRHAQPGPTARMVVIPTIWKHYTAAKIATIYEKAMTDAGIEWRSIDD